MGVVAVPGFWLQPSQHDHNQSTPPAPLPDVLFLAQHCCCCLCLRPLSYKPELWRFRMTFWQEESGI